MLNCYFKIQSSFCLVKLNSNHIAYFGILIRSAECRHLSHSNINQYSTLSVMCCVLFLRPLAMLCFTFIHGVSKKLNRLKLIQTHLIIYQPFSVRQLVGLCTPKTYIWTISETSSMFVCCKLCIAQPRKRGALAPQISSTIKFRIFLEAAC